MATRPNGYQAQHADQEHGERNVASSAQGQLLPGADGARGASSSQGQLLPSADGARGASSTQGQLLPSADGARGASSAQGQLLRSPDDGRDLVILDPNYGKNVGFFRRINLLPLDPLRPQFVKITSDPSAPVNSIPPTINGVDTSSLVADVPDTSDGPSKAVPMKPFRALKPVKRLVTLLPGKLSRDNVMLEIERKRPNYLIGIELLKMIYYFLVFLVVIVSLLRTVNLYLEVPKGVSVSLQLACAPRSIGYAEADLDLLHGDDDRLRHVFGITSQADYDQLISPPKVVRPEEAIAFNIRLGDQVCGGEGTCFYQTTWYPANRQFTYRRHFKNGTFSHVTDYSIGMLRIYVYQCDGQASPHAAAHLDVVADHNALRTTIVREPGAPSGPGPWRRMQAFWDTITLWG